MVLKSANDILRRCAQVCAGVRRCAQVCAGMRRCAQVSYTGIIRHAQVRAGRYNFNYGTLRANTGMHRCAQVRAGRHDLNSEVPK